MLCSHQKKFIYFKTKKTAGTSVEIFFEKYCVPPGQHMESHATKELISEYGIIGSRLGGRESGDTYFNHMSASSIRSNLGDDIFSKYLKFCVMRNPFDKAVSRFWWEVKESLSEPKLVFSLPFNEIKKAFKRFIFSKAPVLADDRGVYMIHQVPVMDYFLRYESLKSDLEFLCQKLDIPYEEENLGSYKSGYRLRPEHFSEYYDDELADLIFKEFDWEINRFSYSL